MSHDPWRSARRAAALRHHPDRGGDAAALQAALDEVDRRFGRTAPGRGATRTTVVTTTVRGRLQARTRRLRRRLSRRRTRRWIDI